MANIRPDLAVDFAAVAKFKLASRKTTYRIGEIISIDMAMLNTSSKPVFILDARAAGVEFSATDGSGGEVGVGSYELVNHALTHDAYRRVEPDYAIFKHFYLLAGYDKQASTITQEKVKLGRAEERMGPANYFKQSFDRNLFINLGDGYLDAKATGAYTISASYSNDTVVIAPGSGDKTAVGSIVSSPLTITITE
jgi:hypothetical protein